MLFEFAGAKETSKSLKSWGRRRMNRGRRTLRSVFVCAYVCAWGRSCKRNAVVVCTKQQLSTTTSKGPHKREQR